MTVEENLEMGSFTRPGSRLIRVWRRCTTASPG